ncbi:hypothetical protein A4H97_15425 [Niastella yeongjuensis]|uniref:Uncharacterized protein n=1 Tax=Niastella yeongjuensis TaxID=354355 RepID=A0A1V9E4H4_9BACT|nr:hypothetical protein [Niastella yeongjuensis]OQP40989.1 hypothetical protein A4H97_15425 [Niastella yeongjuensis]SEO95583.1 hypothetical protein SAMN05660816_03964 [Niastella yeongjuensis]
MGIEWNIGCLKCKRQIWLGSEKPYKWKGFQIKNEDVERFLSLHSQCDKNINGNLLLTNDGTIDIPWYSDDTKLEWQEDILSRTFCFDSWFNKAFYCPGCSKKLDDDEELRKLNGDVKKNSYLWFCNDACFDRYVENYRKNEETIIYDSTNDQQQPATGAVFEVCCTRCKTFVVIDNLKDADEITRDFEYLALFLEEHIGHDHLLKVNFDNNNILWKETKYMDKWKEYVY